MEFVFQLAGVTLANADAVFVSNFLLGLASTYGLDVDVLEVASVSFDAGHLVVRIAARLPESLSLTELQNAGRRRRALQQGKEIEHEAFDVESTLTLATTMRARARRGLGLLSFLSDPAAVLLYGAELLAALQQQFPELFGGITSSSAQVNTEYSAERQAMTTTTTATTTAPTTTSTTTTTAGSSTSATGTTQRPTTTVSTTSTRSFANEALSDSNNRVVSHPQRRRKKERKKKEI